METETAQPEINVTVLQDTPEQPQSEPAQPEIVVLETTIEQTPEANTKWQGEVLEALRSNLERHQQQTAEAITAIQTFRETLGTVLEILLRMETALAALSIPQTQKEPQTQSPQPEAVAEVVAPAEAEAENKNQPARESETRQKRRKI